MFCIAFGGNKDRKTIVKALKGKVKEMALLPSASKVLMFCLDVIDDTVMLRKQICQELIECLPELLASKSGIKVLLHLLAPHSPRYFNPKELEALTVPSLHFDDERKTMVVSKKDAALRHKELLGDRVLPAIVEACIEDPKTLARLIRSPHESAVVVEALRESFGLDFGVSALQQVAALAGPVDEAAMVAEEDGEHVMAHPVAHRCLRRLIFLENPAAENKRAERHKSASGVLAVLAVLFVLWVVLLLISFLLFFNLLSEVLYSFFVPPPPHPSTRYSCNPCHCP
jgi:hypothetical protein